MHDYRRWLVGGGQNINLYITQIHLKKLDIDQAGRGES